MRKAIRDLLVAPGAVPSVGGRVFEPGQAAETTPRPFLTVEEGSQDAGTSFGGKAEPVTVFIEGPQSGSGGKTALRIVDQVEREVKAVLDRKVIADEDTGERLLLMYAGNAGTDVVPPAASGSLPSPVRAIVFNAFALLWQTQQTFSPDPIAGLITLAHPSLGTIQTDPTTWNPSDSSPALYWRLSQIIELQRTNWGEWVTVLFRGHVLCGDDVARRTWVRRIAEYATSQGRVRISDNSPMLLMQVGADYEADAFREGQLAITGRYGVLRETLPEPLPVPLPTTVYSGYSNTAGVALPPTQPINEAGVSLPENDGIEMTVSFP